MTNKQALDILWQVAKAAQLKGALTIEDAVVAHNAYLVLTKSIQDHGDKVNSKD